MAWQAAVVARAGYRTAPWRPFCRNADCRPLVAKKMAPHGGAIFARRRAAHSIVKDNAGRPVMTVAIPAMMPVLVPAVVMPAAPTVVSIMVMPPPMTTVPAADVNRCVLLRGYARFGGRVSGPRGGRQWPAARPARKAGFLVASSLRCSLPRLFLQTSRGPVGPLARRSVV